MPLLSVNGTELYCELRGSGPPLLLIMGASGYGNVFDRFAGLLARDFTVVTYDRRGNGRSACPADWNATSPQEQADDAAALLEELSLVPAAIFGTSSGGVFALASVIRHPRAVRAAVLHEPALFPLFDDPSNVRATVGGLFQAGMRAGGPRTAFERFLRFVAGDGNWDGLDAEVREGMLASASTYLNVERGAFDSYLPDEQTLASITAPVMVLTSDGSHPFFAQAADRLADVLGVEVTRTPGTHFPYLDHPEEFAEAVGAFLRNVDA
jgi:pimeloyl-ACP methyl ester carboxylesterase